MYSAGWWAWGDGGWGVPLNLEAATRPPVPQQPGVGDQRTWRAGVWLSPGADLLPQGRGLLHALLPGALCTWLDHQGKIITHCCHCYMQTISPVGNAWGSKCVCSGNYSIYDYTDKAIRGPRELMAGTVLFIVAAAMYNLLHPNIHPPPCRPSLGFWLVAPLC